jgi:hypothetical protein
MLAIVCVETSGRDTQWRSVVSRNNAIHSYIAARTSKLTFFFKFWGYFPRSWMQSKSLCGFHVCHGAWQYTSVVLYCSFLSLFFYLFGIFASVTFQLLSKRHVCSPLPLILYTFRTEYRGVFFFVIFCFTFWKAFDRHRQRKCGSAAAHVDERQIDYWQWTKREKYFSWTAKNLRMEVAVPAELLTVLQIYTASYSVRLESSGAPLWAPQISQDHRRYMNAWEPGWRSRYSDSLRAGRAGDRIPVGARFSASNQTGSEAHPASCTMDAGSFPGVKAAEAWCWPPTPI